MPIEHSLPPFRILWVEDDVEFINLWTGFLNLDADRLTGETGRKIEITTAHNQEDADEKLRTAPPGGYDLVLLDWQYPAKRGETADSYRGMDWLPTVRHEQPQTPIAIVTNFPTEQGLQPAVRALRDDGADEVIPKTVGWSEALERLQRALLHRQNATRLASTVIPYLSNVARITAEDLQLAVGRARAKMQSVGLSSAGGTSNSEKAFETLAEEIEQIGGRLPRQIKAQLEEVDCAQLAKYEAAMLEAQLPRRITVRAEGKCIARTYREDLRDAFREIVQNAIDAVHETDSFPPHPAVEVDVVGDQTKHSVQIAVLDKGRGFSTDASKSLYAPENCHWARDRHRHKGMGLYVAKRMMLAVGGSIDVVSSGAGSTVTLEVRDWS